MKKVIFIVFLLFGANLLIAQQAKYSTLYTKNLDAYVGAWEYATATDTFRVILKKGKQYNSDGTLNCEIIYGGHLYIKNGQKMADNLNKVLSSTHNNNDMTIFANNGSRMEDNVNPNALRLGFNDKTKEKNGIGTLTLLPGNPARLHWVIKRMVERVFMTEIGVDPEPYIAPGWSVPTDVVLTKISDTIPDDGTRPPHVIDGNLIEVEP